MTPFECYKAYSALKLHFTTDYNYKAYNGAVRLKQESFERRNDKVFFAKVAKHPDALNFLMVNILHDPKAWIRNIAYSKEAEDRYRDWQKKRQSLAYIFKEDLKKLDGSFDENLRTITNQHPPIVVKYLAGDISLETLCVICSITGCIKHWDKKMADDPVWDELSRRVKKYNSFLEFDSSKFKKIILDVFKDQG